MEKNNANFSKKLPLLIGAVGILIVLLGGLVYFVLKPSDLKDGAGFSEEPLPKEVASSGKTVAGNDPALMMDGEKSTGVSQERSVWKNYSNPEVGVSFSYPPTMEVIFDGPADVPSAEDQEEAGEEGYYWHRIVLKDTAASEQPEFVLEIDPDELEPVFSDEEYEVVENDGGKVEIVSLGEEFEVNPDDPSAKDGKVIIAVNAIESINEVTYIPRFSFKEGGRDLTPDFQMMLKSMKFSELEE